MKKIVHLLLRLLFGLRATGTEALREPGPLLLVPNHVSWLDWLFLLVFLEGDWRFVVSAVASEASWLHRSIMRNRRTFAVDPTSPYALKSIAHHLKAGGRLVLFAEGRITFTGSLMKLFDGTGFLLLKTPAKVVTCYLRGANRLKLSRNPGWRRWFPKISLHFSPAMEHPKHPQLKPGAARLALTEWVRTRMLDQQFRTEMAEGVATLPEALLEAARSQPDFEILEDIEQKPLSYKKLVLGADLLAGALHEVLPPGQSRTGVLLPNINATPVSLLALWFLGKTPAVLNFSSGLASMLACARLAGLKTLLTSRAFLTRARLDITPLVEAGIQPVYLEDVRGRIRFPHKLASLLRWRLGGGRFLRTLSKPDSPAVLLFTSGSEGMPKGVQLSHHNILCNIRQMLVVTDLNDTDRIFNALPIFHSFGLTVGTLLGLLRGSAVFLHPSPLHYRLIPNLIYEKNATVFLSTNTFLNGYARRANPYDFRSLRYLFAAAEKVQENTFTTWAQRYGIRVLEGYGATECAPALSLNVPTACKHGSAGRFLPGIEWKLLPVEGIATGGRLLVRGENVMSGYLKADSTQPVPPSEGWYDTGDIVDVDPEGFLHIQGRMKRFAKVSGEMVSLTAVEDALAGAFPVHGSYCLVAVLARPDPAKGEALIAVTNCAELKLRDIREVLRTKGMTNLCAPSELRLSSHIPMLGTGKVNHRELQRLLVENVLPLSKTD